MTAEVEVLHPGLYTTIQDRGRFGFREYGVPVSGAMDLQAAGMANLLLQNDPEAAVMEITLQGPKLLFKASAKIAITGAHLSPTLDGEKLQNNRVYHVDEGQVLGFGKRISGYRSYLGIKDGFQTEEVLGSRSWCPGITKNFRLGKGSKVPFLENISGEAKAFSAVKPIENVALEVIEAYPGPEHELLPASEKEILQNSHFSVGRESNRMGIQISEVFQNSLLPIITGPVIPGTVQLTPSGKMIVLMRDGQTTGGYPRILQLTENAINLLAQKVPGEKLRFVIKDYRSLY